VAMLGRRWGFWAAARFFAGALLCVSASAHAATVAVDGAVEYQTIEGGGTTYNFEGSPLPFPLSDLAAQAHALGFRVVRMEQGDCLEWTNDDADPFHYDWTSYDAQFAAADTILQASRTMQDAGLDLWTEPLVMPPWMCSSGTRYFDSTIPNIYDELAEYWAAWLLYARNNFGVTYPYLSLENEPDCPNCWTEWSADELRDGIKAIGARLSAEGLATRILTPNLMFASSSQSFLQTILADPAAAGHIAANVYHAYDNSSITNGPDVIVANMRNFAGDPLIQASGLPIWETEWTLWYDKRNEAYCHTLRYALDHARFTHYCYAEGQCSLVTGEGIEFGDDIGIFGPGLGDGGARLKKVGHAITQFHRFIEPGSRRIDATVSGEPNLFASAYRHPASGALTIVMLNMSTTPVDVTVNLANLSAPASMRGVRTSATQDSAELGRVAVSGASYTDTLPGESVTTYIGSTVGDSVPPSVPAGVGATALSDTLVRVAWTAATDDVAVAGTKVIRDGMEIGTTAGTSWLDHGLVGATIYSYTVLAFDLAGNESAESLPAHVTTLDDTTPPAVPGHVVATARQNMVTVTWDPSTDSVADHDLAGFRVYRALSAGGPYFPAIDLNDPTTAGWTDTSTPNGQSFHYVVTAYDDEDPANESAFSMEASANPYNRLPGGLQADYYDSTFVDQGGVGGWEWFHTHQVGRIDPAVDYDWATTVPPAGRLIRGYWSLFGARWQGELLADQAEIYTLETWNMDGVRLWVDGRLVLDDWAGWFTHSNSVPVALTPGWHAVRLDYYRFHPDAAEVGVIQLSYSSPSVPRQVVPADHLATVSAGAPPRDHILREVIPGPLAASQAQIALQLSDGLDPYLPSSLPVPWSDPEAVLHESTRPLIFYGVDDPGFPRIAVVKNEAQGTVDIRPRP